MYAVFKIAVRLSDAALRAVEVVATRLFRVRNSAKNKAVAAGIANARETIDSLGAVAQARRQTCEKIAQENLALARTIQQDAANNILAQSKKLDALYRGELP